MTGQVRSVIVQRTFCPLYIWYILVLSVIHPLLIRQSPLDDRSLSVTCPLHMRYSCVLCAPYTFCKDPHHRMNTGLTFFFSVLSASVIRLSVTAPLDSNYQMTLSLRLRTYATKYFPHCNIFNTLHSVCFMHGLSIYEIKRICSIFHNLIWKFKPFDKFSEPNRSP